MRWTLKHLHGQPASLTENYSKAKKIPDALLLRLAMQAAKMLPKNVSSGANFTVQQVLPYEKEGVFTLGQIEIMDTAVFTDTDAKLYDCRSNCFSFETC